VVDGKLTEKSFKPCRRMRRFGKDVRVERQA